eukprot:12475529-Ditylum_brightwellii.AAC.1
MSEKAAAYSGHVKELVVKHDELRNENISLRNVVKKNNVMYLAKVEQLSKEFDVLKKTNAALKESLKETVQAKVAKLKENRFSSLDLTSDTMREACSGIDISGEIWSTGDSIGKNSRASGNAMGTHVNLSDEIWSTGDSRGKNSRASKNSRSSATTMATHDLSNSKYDELEKNNAALKAAMKEI